MARAPRGGGRRYQGYGHPRSRRGTLFCTIARLMMREYLYTRQFLHDDGSYLVPVVDLVNHSVVAQPYVKRGGYRRRRHVRR